MSRLEDTPSRAVPSLDTATTPEESHSPMTAPEEPSRRYKAGLAILDFLAVALTAVPVLGVAILAVCAGWMLSAIAPPVFNLAVYIMAAAGIGGLALRARVRHLSRRQAQQQAMRLHERKVAELKAGPARQITWAEGAAFLLWRDNEITSDQLASLRPWFASFGAALRATRGTSRTPDVTRSTTEGSAS